MALEIISARNVEHSYDLIRGKSKNYCSVFEYKNLDSFLYDYRNLLVNYDYYYKFNPYGTTFLENSDVVKIENFANSILQLVNSDNFDENKVISRYNISSKKLTKFSQKLLEVCLFAKENNFGLVGLGD